MNADSKAQKINAEEAPAAAAALLRDVPFQKSTLGDAPKKRSENRGGVRPGAGRPKGSRDRKNAILIQAKAEGSNPLDIMRSAMVTFYVAAHRKPDNVDVEYLEMAARFARDLAPYEHPKLISQEIGGKTGASPILMQTTVRTVEIPNNGRILSLVKTAA